jgi:recombination protein RecA
VIDTLDYLQPLAVINAESTDQFMGGAAKANNRFIARLIELCRKHDCTAIIVSQIRQKVGFVMGSNEVIGGGTSINYGPHVRIDIRKSEVLKDKAGNEYGQVVKMKSTKNKTFIPQKTTYAQIIWGDGFDKIADYLDIAVEDGVITKGGAWYSYGDLKVQGAESMLEKLKSDEKLLNEIKKKIGMN